MYHTHCMYLTFPFTETCRHYMFVDVKKQKWSKSPDLFVCYRYNDVPLIYDQAIYEQLREADIDHLLAQHIAHLFIRDSVSLFSEKVNQDDEQDTDHFEVYHL